MVRPNACEPFDDDNTLEFLREQLRTTGYVFIPGRCFRRLLQELGASEEDLIAMENGEVHEKVAPDPEPAMKHRQAAIHRVVLEANKQPRKTETPGVTQLLAEEIVSDSTESAFDRCKLRVWPLPPSSYADGSVWPAIGRVISAVQPAEHHPLRNVNHLSGTTINDQILLRVRKDSVSDEATPEGVHQDGSELTGVTLIDRHNVNGGGESRLWSLKQPAGNYDSPRFGDLNPHPKTPTPKGFDWNNCLLNRPLTRPWDTLIFNDRMVKHEVRPFFGGGEGLRCHRDVIVNLVRKPLSDGSDTIRVDGQIVSLQ